MSDDSYSTHYIATEVMPSHMQPIHAVRWYKHEHLKKELLFQPCLSVSFTRGNDVHACYSCVAASNFRL